MDQSLSCFDFTNMQVAVKCIRGISSSDAKVQLVQLVSFAFVGHVC